jgi:Na+-translocating ferredoxin:NAD+ oxidoreductase RnfG subunit
MNSTQQPDVEMKKSIVFLVLAALGGTLLLNLTEENTREQREQNAMLYESRMLKEVLPEKAYDPSGYWSA